MPNERISDHAQRGRRAKNIPGSGCIFPRGNHEGQARRHCHKEGPFLRTNGIWVNRRTRASGTKNTNQSPPRQTSLMRDTRFRLIPEIHLWQTLSNLVEVVGGVKSARERDSSIGGGAGNVCLGAVHMEEEVQYRVQVDVGREEQGEGETHGKEQSEEQRENIRSINRSSWMTMRMG